MPRVLVIDDEPRLRRTLADYLEDMGCDTALAGKGAEGLEALEGFQPDVVLVDLNMPVMDGYAFIDAARTRQPDLPVIVVSGVGTVDKAVEAIRLGAWGLQQQDCPFVTCPYARTDTAAGGLSPFLPRRSTHSTALRAWAGPAR